MIATAIIALSIVCATLAQPTQPCGKYIQTFASSKTPTVLSQFVSPAYSLNITCGIADFPSDATAIIALSVACSVTPTGPYFVFPKGPYMDYFTASSYFVCPFPGINYFSAVAFNTYTQPVLVKSAIMGILQSGSGKDVATAEPRKITSTHPRSGLPTPSLCGGRYSQSVGGQSSSMVMYWLTPANTFTLTCFGVYADTPADLEVVVACSETTSFSGNVVPLGLIGAYTPTAASFVCPFKGYFGVIIRNNANTAASLSYYGTGDAGESKQPAVVV